MYMYACAYTYHIILSVLKIVLFAASWPLHATCVVGPICWVVLLCLLDGVLLWSSCVRCTGAFPNSRPLVEDSARRGVHGL